MTQQGLETPRLTNIPMTGQQRWTTFGKGLLFVAGFATFVIGLFGLIGTVLGDVIYDAKDIVRVVGGIALIAFGLFTLHIIRIPALYNDTRGGMMATASKSASVLQPYLVGLSFAAGWTPCIGPFLGAILSMSVTAESLWLRLGLLTAYTLGLGVPFLLFALLADRMLPLFNRLKRHMRIIEIVSGMLLIGIGILMLTGQMAQWSSGLASTAAASGFSLETLVLGSGRLGTPSILIAALAGFLSFASPCVLPLVPVYIGVIGGYAVGYARQEIEHPNASLSSIGQ